MADLSLLKRLHVLLLLLVMMIIIVVTTYWLWCCDSVYADDAICSDSVCQSGAQCGEVMNQVVCHCLSGTGGERCADSMN